MKILMLYSRIPSSIGGDRIRVYHVIKRLSTKHQIDLLSLNEGKLPPNGTDHLEDICNEIYLFSQHPLRFRINAAKGIFQKSPLQVNYYYFKKIHKWIKENYKRYDLIYCNHIWMAKYVEDVDLPKVIDFVDSSGLFCNRAVEFSKGFWKYFFNIEKQRVPGYEGNLVLKFDKCFITSKFDRKFIIKNLPPKHKAGLQEKIKDIPMGVKEDVVKRRPWYKEEDWIVFCSYLKAIHNKDAAYFFAKNIFPRIRRKNKQVQFMIVGADPPRHIMALKKEDGIVVTGYVDDPYYYLERAKVIVAPMRLCTGVQDKVLEGMALGKVVVCSPRAVEGIEGKDGIHYIVAHDEHQMVKIVCSLMNDRNRRIEIGNNARKLIAQKYSWELLGKKFLDEIDDVLKN